MFLSDVDVAALADWRSPVAALSAAYATDMRPVMVPPRSMARGDGFWLRSLTAVLPVFMAGMAERHRSSPAANGGHSDLQCAVR